MPARYRNPDDGSGHSDIRITQDLAGFVDKFHFFGRIALVVKVSAMRNHVVVDRVMIGFHRAFEAFFLVFHLLQAFDARTADGLVGGDDQTLDTVCFVDGAECHDHLDCAAVRVGDNPVFGLDGIHVDFRNHQGNVRVHAPGRGIVHHGAALFGKEGGVLLGGRSPGREDGIVGTGCDGIFYRYDLVGFACKFDFLSDGTGRSGRQEFYVGKAIFF